MPDVQMLPDVSNSVYDALRRRDSMSAFYAAIAREDRIEAVQLLLAAGVEQGTALGIVESFVIDDDRSP